MGKAILMTALVALPFGPPLAWAEDPLTLTASGASEECRLDHLVGANEFYLCGSPADTILFNSKNGWKFVGLRQDRLVSPMTNFEVRRGDSPVFVVGDGAGFFGANTSNAPLEPNLGMRMNELTASAKWLAADDVYAADKGRTPGTPEYEQFRAALAAAGENELSARKKKLTGLGALDVTLSDGRKLTCRRGATDTAALRDEIAKAPKDVQKLVGLDRELQLAGEEAVRTSIDRGCELFLCPKIRVGDREVTPVVWQSLEGGSSQPFLSLGTAAGFARGVSLARTEIAGGDPPLLYFNLGFSQPNNDELLLPSELRDRGVSTSDLANEGGLRFENRKCAGLGAVDAQLATLARARETLAATQTVQLIDSILGGLNSQLVAASGVPGDACEIRRGIFMTPAALAQADEYIAKILPAARGTISSARADALFKEVAAMKDIPFGYVEDGCWARAEVVARRLAEKGVETEKIWIQGPGLAPKGREDTNWKFHVAVVVKVRQSDGTVRKEVIDPSLSAKIETPEEWESHMSFSGVRPPQRTSYPPPYNGEFYGRAVVAYSSSAVYNPGGSQSPEKNLQDALDELAQETRALEERKKGAP